MTVPADTSTPFSPSEVFRWCACAALVLIAHGLVLLVMSTFSDEADLDSGSSVIAIELAPMPVAPPAPPNDLAPGPEQTQTETREIAREDPEPEHRPSDDKPIPLPPAPDPVVTLQPPEPIKPPVEAKPEPEPQPPASVPTAPPTAVVPDAHPAAPDPGRIPQPTLVALGWERQLVARIERHKRYPPRANGEHGVASLAFRIDRQGNLISSRIIHSSGSSVLDAEALATVKRAQPFPAPPADIPDNHLSFILPIRYAVSAQR